MDSGAAVSLIHLQAYKLMPDTLKTAITLPGELETNDSQQFTHAYHRTCNKYSSPEEPLSDSPFHHSQITDDRRHIGYRLPERIQNIL